MPTVDVVNEKNKKTGQVDLPEKLFAGAVNRPLLHEVVTLWMRGRRAGTSSTKGRSDVSGGGRKPWKQKGTGRARAGSSRSPLWVGGGTIHGPKPRDYETSVSKKKRDGALRSALAHHFQAGSVIVLDGFALDGPKTNKVAGLLKGLGLGGEKVLIVAPANEPVLVKSVRNIAGVTVTTPEGLNPYLVVYHRKLVILKDALPRMEEVLKP